MFSKKDCVIFMIIAFFLLTAASHSAEKINGKDYRNERFSYSIYIPNIFHITDKSENNDGITLKTNKKDSVLLVWGQNNIENSDGHALLKSALDRAAYIQDKASGKNFYMIKYGAAGEDGSGHCFYEYGILNKGKIAVFELRYPIEKEAQFLKIIETLKSSFKFLDN